MPTTRVKSGEKQGRKVREERDGGGRGALYMYVYMYSLRGGDRRRERRGIDKKTSCIFVTYTVIYLIRHLSFSPGPSHYSLGVGVPPPDPRGVTGPAYPPNERLGTRLTPAFIVLSVPWRV